MMTRNGNGPAGDRAARAKAAPSTHDTPDYTAHDPAAFVAAEIHADPRGVAERLEKIDWIIANMLLRPLDKDKAHVIGDSCLHSTVAAIERRRGIRVEREWCSYRNFVGRKTRYARYSIADEARARAAAMIAEKLRADT